MLTMLTELAGLVAAKDGPVEAERYTGPDAAKLSWGRLVIRDEGDANWIRFDLCDEHGVYASVRCTRATLAPLARALLDAAIRNP